MSNCEQREGKWSHQSNISMCVEWVYAMNGTLQVDLIESTRAESLDEIIPELPDANEDVVVSFLKKQNKRVESNHSAFVDDFSEKLAKRRWPKVQKRTLWLWPCKSRRHLAANKVVGTWLEALAFTWPPPLINSTVAFQISKLYNLISLSRKRVA